MRSNYRRTLDSIYENIESIFRKVKYIKEAKRIHRKLDKKITVDEYKSKILPFWKEFGIKPKKYWFDVFNKIDVDPRYIPNNIYYGKILPYFSNMSFRRFAEDKTLLHEKFPEFQFPKTIVKNTAGVYYDEKDSILSLENVIKKLKELDEFIIKPSIDSGGGRGVKIIHDINSSSIEKLLLQYKNNFIVQEVVKQSALLDSLNPTSLNTIRIITFLFNDEVYVLSSVLRIGKLGSEVDNISAGGIQCNIKENGILESFAYDSNHTKYLKSETGIKFEEVQIPNYDKIVKLVKKAQSRQAHFKMIGWDFSLDQNDSPIFIEYNVCPGNNQMTSGPHFGELTKQVLQDVYIDKQYKNANN